MKQGGEDRTYYYPFRKPRNIDAFDLKDQYGKTRVYLTTQCIVLTYGFHIAALEYPFMVIFIILFSILKSKKMTYVFQ